MGTLTFGNPFLRYPNPKPSSGRVGRGSLTTKRLPIKSYGFRFTFLGSGFGVQVLAVWGFLGSKVLGFWFGVGFRVTPSRKMNPYALHHDGLLRLHIYIYLENRNNLGVTGWGLQSILESNYKVSTVGTLKVAV